MKSATAPLPEALQPLELIEGKVTPASLDDQVLKFPGLRHRAPGTSPWPSR
jgi:hypothetical protein